MLNAFMNVGCITVVAQSKIKYSIMSIRVFFSSNILYLFPQALLKTLSRCSPANRFYICRVAPTDLFLFETSYKNRWRTLNNSIPVMRRINKCVHEYSAIQFISLQLQKSLRKTLQQRAQSAVQLLPFPKVLPAFTRLWLLSASRTFFFYSRL